MVAKRRVFTPCPPSPARAAIDPKTEDWILRWLEDLSTLYPDLLDDLPGYAKALIMQSRLQNFCFSGFHA